MTPCHCGCGHLARRTYAPGHNPKPSPNQDAVLAALAVGPLPASLLRKRTGLDEYGVSNALRRLRDRGLVGMSEGGRWGITMRDVEEAAK